MGFHVFKKITRRVSFQVNFFRLKPRLDPPAGTQVNFFLRGF
jgi:hypothetical protein